jgi:flagella synthesis protein FlgN
MQKSGISPAERLGDEFSSGQVLLRVLQQEQELLINADIDGLTSLTEEKTKAVARMNELAQHRHRSLATAGFDASESGMQEWVTSPAGAPAVGKVWNALLDLARQAKELNRVNGMLISQHMARNQSALNVLQGTPQGGNMYGPNGQAAPRSSSRKLVVG